jgi:ABC-type nitrate/sulfonate/bicarbonate transport system permease component
MMPQPVIDAEVPTAHAPVTRRRGRDGARGATVLRRVEPALVTLAFVALWELFSRSGAVSSHDFPPATDIAQAFVKDIQHRAVWTGIGESMKAWAIGLAIVVVVGVPMGLLLGLSRFAYAAVRPTLDLVRTVPSIAGLPILLFIYGIGLKLNVSLVLIAAIWPILIQTMYGAHDVDPVARDTARVYGLSRGRAFFKVVLPGALPYIVTGLRLSAVIALLVAVAASLIVGGEGLGAQIDVAQRNDLTELMYARIVMTSLLGLAVTFTLLRAERRVLRWHPSQRETA